MKKVDEQPTILTIEDDDFLRANIAAFLEDSGYHVLQADNGEGGLDLFRRLRPDLVLLDLRMPVVDGLDVLKSMREESEGTPVIVVSGMGVIDDVVTSLRLGAWDYIIKPIEDMEILGHATRNALEKAALLRENREYQTNLETLVASRTTELRTANEELEELRRRLELENEYLREEIFPQAPRGPFVGRSEALSHTLQQIEHVAPIDVNVLITGETGTGKELVARMLHERGNRHERPLVKVNCASIPRDLFESEFFGHLKGAFTGAVRDRVGRFQLAHGGTLFLDEVGEIPSELQGKLLRVLQSGEVERVGESVTRQVDVRVIAATNRDIEAEVKAGRFREDLYYRLNVYPIALTPLRERVADIAPLAVHFLTRVCRHLGVPEPTLKQRHVKALEAHDWPGNVRELENIIERSVILSRGGPLRLDLQPPDQDPRMASPVTRQLGGSDQEDDDVLTEEEMQRQQRDNIVKALRKTRWRVSGAGGAAELLGLRSTTLAYRMKVMGISKP